MRSSNFPNYYSDIIYVLHLLLKFVGGLPTAVCLPSLLILCLNFAFTQQTRAFKVLSRPGNAE